jgi:hypothetical protein
VKKSSVSIPERNSSQLHIPVIFALDRADALALFNRKSLAGLQLRMQIEPERSLNKQREACNV